MQAKQGAKIGEVDRKLYYIPFLALCGVLLLFASLQDLQIDRFLNSGDSHFGRMFADIGELPVYCIIPFSTMVLFGALEKNSKAYMLKKIGICAFSLFGWLALILVNIGMNVFGDIEDRNETFFYCLFGLLSVLFCVLSLNLARRVPKETMQKLKPFVIMLMLAALCTAVATEFIKNLVGRVRFRDLAKNGGDAAFTNWFIINGFGSSNKSFPSGHTSAAASLISLMALPDVFRNLKRYEIDLFVLGAVYTFLVGLSRMIVGAHYLSDITVGTLIGFCSIALFRKYYLAKRLPQA